MIINYSYKDMTIWQGNRYSYNNQVAQWRLWTKWKSGDNGSGE